MESVLSTTTTDGGGGGPSDEYYSSEGHEWGLVDVSVRAVRGAVRVVERASVVGGGCDGGNGHAGVGDPAVFPDLHGDEVYGTHTSEQTIPTATTVSAHAGRNSRCRRNCL